MNFAQTTGGINHLRAALPESSSILARMRALWSCPEERLFTARRTRKKIVLLPLRLHVGAMDHRLPDLSGLESARPRRAIANSTGPALVGAFAEDQSAILS